MFAFFNGGKNVCSRAQQGSIIRINKCFHKQVILLDDIALENYLKMSAFIECLVLLLLMVRGKKAVYNDEVTLYIDTVQKVV